jgi:hypothetical protein
MKKLLLIFSMWVCEDSIQSSYIEENKNVSQLNLFSLCFLFLGKKAEKLFMNLMKLLNAMI